MSCNRFARWSTILALLAFLTFAVVGCGEGSDTTAAEGSSAEAVDTLESSDGSGVASNASFHQPLECDVSPTTAELLNTKAPKAKKPYDLTLMEVSLSAYSYQSYAYGAQKAAEEAGANLSIIAAEGYEDPSKQLEQAENVLQRGTEGIVLAPVDPQGSVPIVEKAQAQGVPVVNISTEVDSDDAYKVLQDDYAQGKVSADQIAEIEPEGGPGIVMAGPANASWSRRRVAGFEDRMKEKYPNFEIVAAPTGLVDPAEGAKDLQNALQAHPDINWIYSVNVAVLTPEGVPSQYRDKPMITTGFEPLVIEAMEDGTIAGTISIDQVWMGYTAVSELIEKLNGGEPPKVTCLPNPKIDLSEINDPYPQSELKPEDYEASAG